MGSKPSTREKDAKIQALMDEVQLLKAKQETDAPVQSGGIDRLLITFDEEQILLRKNSCGKLQNFGFGNF